MNQKIDTKKTSLRVGSLMLLLATIVMLPVCLLVPFMDHSSHLKPALPGLKSICTTNATLLTRNQCATWLEPRTIWPMAILFLVALVVFGLGMNAYASRLAHRDGRRFANYRFVLVLLVSVFGFMAFAIMRGQSQNYDSYHFELVPYTLTQDNGTADYSLVNAARFGYGLTPMMVALLITGFVVPAFVSWHQFMYSRNHIDGQKKDELFQ